jgi:hypothetical protein
MSVLRKTTQAVTLLLVLLMSTMLVLPPGMDLEFCFGKDGHIDVSLNGCEDGASPKIPAREWPSAYDAPHHGDCLDVAVACSATQQIIRSDGKSDSFSHKSAPKKDPSGTTFLPSEFLAASAGAFSGADIYPVSPEDVSSSHLVFLRTVVLLI